MPCPSLKQIQRTIIRIVDASPVALLLLIFSWSFWAYLFSLCLGLIKEGNTLHGVLYIFFYIPLFVLCLWSYWTVCRTSPGYTSSKGLGKPQEDEEDTVGLLNEYNSKSDQVATLDLEDNAHHTPIPITVKRDGAKRYCQKCKLDKFDRTHHCRHCKKCVLKMDHHCPWINNCVGFQNYKAFYLFLLYASLYCVYVFATTLPQVIIQVNGPMSILGLNLNCGVLVFISGIFGLFLVPFTIFHTRQLCKNRTTIEFYEKANYRLGDGSSRDIMRTKYFNPWDIGTRKNIEQVLGKGPLWQKLIPIGRPLGDGTAFPINTYAYDTLGTDEVDL